MKNTSVLSETVGIEIPTEFAKSLENVVKKSAFDYHDNSELGLIKAKTAVFTSALVEGDPAFTEDELRAKIKEDLTRLIGLGHDTIVVNTGTRYGMLALRELVAVRDEMPFRLIRSKIRGEWSDEPNHQDAVLLSNCDSFFYANNAEHYNEIILSQSSFISDETGLEVK